METDDEPSLEDLKESMFLKILSTKNVFYKSQQRDEPELDDTQKLEILNEILLNNKATFLCRYGKYLNQNHLALFDPSSGYEIQHHLAEIQFRLANQQKIVRNRRLTALKQLIEKGEYFSEAEMMRREPILYENLVGQYMTAEEKRERDFEECPGNSLVNMIYQGIDNDTAKAVEDVEEFDTDNEDEMEEEDPYETPYSKVQWGNFDVEEKRLEFPVSNKNCLNAAKKEPNFIMAPEKELLKDEFTGIMYSNFLSGKDATFDYSSVDENSEFDDEVLRSRDLEDKYFDSEDTDEKMQQDKSSETSEEDALDVYMKHLSQQIHRREVDEMTDKLEFLEKE